MIRNLEYVGSVYAPREDETNYHRGGSAALETTCVASTTLDKWLPTQRRTVVAEDLGARKLLGCRLPVAMDASAEMPKVGDWRLAAAFDSVEPHIANFRKFN